MLLTRLRSLGRDVSRFVEWTRRYGSADDIFISYSRADGVIYAQALASELARRGFTCRIDLYDTDTDAELPARLKTAIRRAYLLIVVGTPAAWTSRFVRLEIDEFRTTGRHYLAVGFGEDIRNAVWYEAVAGRVVQERRRALLTGRPSAAIVALTEGSFHFRKRNARLRRVAAATAAGVAAIVLIGLAATYLLQRNLTTKQAELAGAQNQLSEVRSSLVRTDSQLASSQAQLVTSQAQLSETQRGLREAADAAQRQGMVAEARRTATEALRVRNQLGYTPVQQLVSTIGAARSLRSLGLLVDADAALRDHLSSISMLMPASVPAPSVAGQQVEGPVSSDDGSVLAGRTKDGKAVVWRRGEASVWRQFSCPVRPMIYLRLSPDGRYVAYGCETGLFMFDLASGTSVAGLPDGYGQVAFGPNSTVFFVAGETVENLSGFDLKTGTRIPMRLPETGPPRMLLSPDGRYLVTSCRWLAGEKPARCFVRLYRLPTLELLLSQRETDESRPVFSRRGDYLAASVGGVMRIWETASQLLQATYQVPRSMTQFRFGLDPAKLYGVTDTDVRVLDTFSGDAIAVFPGARTIRDVPDDANAVVVVDETWRLQSLTRTAFLEAKGRAGRTAFDASGRYLAVCTFEGQEPIYRLIVWDVQSGQQLFETEMAGCQFAFDVSRPSLAFQSDDRAVSVLSLPGSQRTKIPWKRDLAAIVSDRALGWLGITADWEPQGLWALEAGKLLRDLPRRGDVWRLNEVLPLEHGREWTRVLDWSVGREKNVRTLPANSYDSIRARNGRVLLLKRNVIGRTLEIFELETARSLLKLDFNAGATALNQDGTLLAAASSDDIRIWDIRSGELRLRRPAPGAVSQLAFTPDDRFLLVSTGSTTTRPSLFPWRLEDVTETACSILQNNAGSRLASMRPDAALLRTACPTSSTLR